VWPFDRSNHVIRLGREGVERWGRHGMGWLRHDAEVVESPDSAALGLAIKTLLARATKDSKHPLSRDLDLVAESAWMPVITLDVGVTVLTHAETERYARHRIADVYGSGQARGGEGWDVYLDYRIGERGGLAYALEKTVKATVLNAAEQATGRRSRSLQPGYAWGQVQLQRQLPKRGWWVWFELDRTIVGHHVRGRVLALNAGAARPRDAAQVLRLVRAEAARHGLDASLPITVSGWSGSDFVPAARLPDSLSTAFVAGPNAAARTDAQAHVLEGSAT